MCLAVPAEIVELTGQTAMVELSGNRLNVNVSLIEQPALGDHVLVHAGFAIAKLSGEELADTLSAFEMLEEARDEEEG